MPNYVFMHSSRCLPHGIIQQVLLGTITTSSALCVRRRFRKFKSTIFTSDYTSLFQENPKLGFYFLNSGPARNKDLKKKKSLLMILAGTIAFILRPTQNQTPPVSKVLFTKEKI